MEEGVTQGCPLSATFAALVLTCALIPLYDKLKLRAKERLDNGNPGDNGFGSLAQIFAYIDDISTMIHHQDMNFS